MLALSDELVAKVSRQLEDAGPAPDLQYLSDEELVRLRQELLADLPDGEHLWIFAYGSLLWDPCFPIAEERVGTVHGWHRRFCLWLTRWRGTRERPGLMLALDRGGSCRGVLCRIAADKRGAALDSLLWREMGATPPTNVPRWVSVRSGSETVKAIAFVADPSGPAYAATLPDDKTVPVLALAAGHIGSCADYLHKTVRCLERHAIRDRNLWRLQGKVAAFIAACEVCDLLPNREPEVHHACEG